MIEDWEVEIEEIQGLSQEVFFIDLTNSIDKSENRIIGLEKAGIYKLPFFNYLNEKKNERIVNVVYVAPENARMQAIIVESEGKFQDFYFNGGFKALGEVGGDLESWWEEEMGVPCPEKYSKIRVSDLGLIIHPYFLNYNLMES